MCYVKVFIALFTIINLLLGLNSIELKEKDWWEKTIFYQIYPRSFKDSDGDGIGDINGITSKLQYLKDTGIGATWLSPIFQSPMVDFGYDISNFTSIHSEYGTMKDFETLMTEAKRLGIKIILDFVPNHSSDKCEWFKKSVKREAGYENYYVWRDGRPNPSGGSQLPPNNWVSVFYGSAWTWNEVRGQFYLHQFTREQPDLNYLEPKVVEEMNNVLTFWLAKGVDGFRVDAINHMFEDKEFIDEPWSQKSNDPDSYDYLDHIYSRDLLPTYDMIYEWRHLLDEWKNKNGGDTKIMMTEAYANITFTMKYYKSDDGSRNGSHIPFNFLLITDLNSQSDARDIVFTINKWMSYMPLGETPNWVLGNHDNSRVGSRYKPERIDALNMLLLTLPGVAVTYNGDEIGMLDNEEISWEDTVDPMALNTNKDIYKSHTRDPERTPFQWDDTKKAGFSSAEKTWLPVNSNYKTLNLESQQKALKSHYKLYKQLAEIRKNPTMTHGSLQLIALDNNILAYSRELKDHKTFLVVINMANKSSQADLSVLDISLPIKFEVVVSGINSNFNVGDKVNIKALKLKEFESLVLKGFANNLKLSVILVISFSLKSLFI